MFADTCIGATDLCSKFEEAFDDYNSIMVKALADRLAEVSSFLHGSARTRGTADKFP